MKFIKINENSKSLTVKDVPVNRLFIYEGRLAIQGSENDYITFLTDVHGFLDVEDRYVENNDSVGKILDDIIGIDYGS